MALFQTSLVRGFNAGFILAMGILVSDLMIIVLSYFGLSTLIYKGDYKIMGIVAGIILMVMGGVSFFSNPLMIEKKSITVFRNSLPVLLIKGFLINISNPFNVIFWIGITGFAAKKWGMQSSNIVLFFAGILVTEFITDLLKCYLTELLGKILVSKWVIWMNKILGFTLFCIGIFIIFKVG
jgi:threonine/homoserine/homoserine lactone efflux protein